jgi:hypothetical protein
MAVQTDTLLFLPDSSLLPVGEPVREESVFGEGGTLSASLTAATEPQPLSDPQANNLMILNGLLLLLFFLYAVLVYRHRSSIVALFSATVMKGHLNQLAEEQSVTFRSFLRLGNTTALLAVLVVGLKVALEWQKINPGSFIPAPFIPWLAAIGVAIGVLLWMYKRLISGIIALLSGDRETVGKIFLFHRILFVGAATLFIPPMILLVLSDFQEYKSIFIVALSLLAGLLLYALAKSFSFFLGRKISILQWFLYLCVVEIVPISFFVLLALRDFRL